MKNLSFLFAAIAVFSMALTSCSDDEMPTPDTTQMVECDSFSVSIAIDSTNVTTTLLTAITNGGLAPYEYSWSNGDTDSSIEIDTDGDYSVTVTDANNCTTETSLSAMFGLNCLSLNLAISGEESSEGYDLTATVEGGTAPYTYTWTNGATAATTTVTEYGTYGLSVTDSEGCVAAGVYTYENGDPCFGFDVTVTVQEDTLSGNNTGWWLQALTEGGTSPYEYLWSDGSTDNYTTTEEESGSFSVTVTDANGCTTEDDVEF